MAVTLPPNRLQLAEHYIKSYAVVLPEAVSLDDALKPEYWAHVGPKLKQHDIVRLIPEDGSYFAEAIVLAAGKGYARLKVLRHEVLFGNDNAEADSVAAPALVELYVKWQGPHAKWAVIRKSDSEKLRDGFSDKGEAERWMGDHLRSLAR